MRPIDADKAKEKLRGNAQKDGNPFVGAIVKMFCEFLDQAPTVEDAEERGEIGSVPRWIPVTTETMPPVDQEVIVRFAYGQRRGITHAMYHDGTVLTEDSDHIWEEIYEWGDYDEETDDYFIPKGWYETSHFSEYIALIDLPVTHWMPFPTLPEVE